jgi:hypothetical protein
MDGLLKKVQQELERYEHPLFVFEAREHADGVEVLIRFAAPEPEVHVYAYVLREREIANGQFPWTFQRQLYDCLHDFVIEMFTRNPQREN